MSNAALLAFLCELVPGGVSKQIYAAGTMTNPAPGTAPSPDRVTAQEQRRCALIPALSTALGAGPRNNNKESP